MSELKDFTQAVGVKHLEVAHGPNQEVHCLLRFQKGASLRLKRTVGDWREIILRWNGTWLFEEYPEKKYARPAA